MMLINAKGWSIIIAGVATSASDENNRCTKACA
jgi:hypothetical protein